MRAKALHIVKRSFDDLHAIQNAVQPPMACFGAQQHRDVMPARNQILDHAGTDKSACSSHCDTHRFPSDEAAQFFESSSNAIMSRLMPGLIGNRETQSMRGLEQRNSQEIKRNQPAIVNRRIVQAVSCKQCPMPAL